MIKSITIAAVGLWVIVGGVASAQDTGDKATERRVRDMSMAIGNAYACTDKEAQQTFKKKSHYLFDLILQDEGSDPAFLYATGIGYGSSLPKDKLDCATLLMLWEEIREGFELKGDKW